MNTKSRKIIKVLKINILIYCVLPIALVSCYHLTKHEVTCKIDSIYMCKYKNTGDIVFKVKDALIPNKNNYLYINRAVDQGLTCEHFSKFVGTIVKIESRGNSIKSISYNDKFIYEPK